MSIRPTAAILLSVMLSLSISGCVSTNSGASDFEIIGFDHIRAFGDIVELCKIGPRLSGTENEAKGTEYFVNEFEDAGLSNVHVEYFEMVCYEVERASLALVRYDVLGFTEMSRMQFIHGEDFILQGYSGSTNGPVLLDVVYAGNGTEAGYENAPEVAYKAAIVQKSPAVSYSTALLNAANSGASANIFHNVNIHPGLDCPPISFGASGRDEDGTFVTYPEAYPGKSIPSMMVSNATGQAILDAINTTAIPGTLFTQYKLEIDVSVKIETREIPVVIAEVEGNGDEFVLVGAHSDTTYVSPGAVDNTGGACTVIEMARQLAGKNPKHTIRFALWSGEEEGLFGSTYYFNAHQQEINESMISYLNLDMNHIDLTRGCSGSINSNDNATLRILENITERATETNPGLSKFQISFGWWSGLGGSDQSAFAGAGKNYACFWGSGADEYHTIWDTVEHVTPEGLAPGGIILGSYALWLADN